MVKVLKNKMDITGAAVLLMAFFVAVGFTTAKEMQQTGWYEVEIKDGGSATNPSDQEIREHLPSGPEGDCLNEAGTICAVQLTVTSGSFPSNMKEANDFTNVQINGESYRN